MTHSIATPNPFTPNQEREYERDLDAELYSQAREDILAFTVATKPDYKVNWHHQILADKLNAFARGEIRYLMVFMPPRHGKSELVSRKLPAFLHGLYPDSEIMAASYLSELASEMCIAAQETIDSPEYAQIFPDIIIQSPRAVYTKGVRNTLQHTIHDRVSGKRRGRYMANGVGGSFTGKGANFVLVDDPIKGREIADSLAFRERLWKFWLSDLYSRLETSLKTGQKAQALVTLTRWHEDDLAGRLLSTMKKDPKAMQWEVLSLPAIKVDDSNPIDPRQVGQALWPARADIDKLEEIRATLTAEGGARAWSSLYQQTPVPDDGVLFQPSHFELVDIPTTHKFTYKFATCDTAYKEKEQNDFHVFSLWGVVHTDLYLIDCFRKQIRSTEAEAALCAFLSPHVGYGYRGTWIEPKGHGIFLNQKLRGSKFLIPGDRDVEEFYSDRRSDKVARANNAVPHLATRTVKVSRSIRGRDELVSEALHFPNGTHDDFVDTLVDALKKAYGDRPGILQALGGR